MQFETRNFLDFVHYIWQNDKLIISYISPLTYIGIIYKDASSNDRINISNKFIHTFQTIYKCSPTKREYDNSVEIELPQINTNYVVNGIKYCIDKLI